MGREAKILLSFLGLLAGVFCGVLSMKLLVPRPPVGAGPDIDAASGFAEPTEIVEPPLLAAVLPLQATDFAAAPPLVDPLAAPPSAAPPSGEPPAAEPPSVESFAAEPLAAVLPAAEAPSEPPPDGDLPPPPAEFVLAPPARPIDETQPAATEPRDPFVARTGWQPPPPVAASDVALRDVRPPDAAPPAGTHVVRPGESWWSLAEAAYGDGRLYRALFAWNRAVDARVTLAAGTPLEVPPLEKLRAAWPKLVPPSGP